MFIILTYRAHTILILCPYQITILGKNQLCFQNKQKQYNIHSMTLVNNFKLLLKFILRVNIKETRYMGWDMDKEYFITTKVVSMLDNGDKTRWTVKEFYITLIIKWLMMVNGSKINFKVMVLCTMKKCVNWLFHLIIKIGMMSMSIG